MDWLKKLPGIGPLVTWLMTTHAWRSYARLDRVNWTWLAAAMTFVSFVALFPLLTVAAAITAATLSPSKQQTVQRQIADQFPGLADKLDLGTLVQNAGTIGLIAGAALLFTGVGWVGQIRDCLRAVWELPDRGQNPILVKLKDAGILLGLGGALLVTLAASTLASAAIDWAGRQIGLDEHGWGTVLLRVVAFAIAVLADFLILLYVLTLLPGVEPPRRRLMVAALVGAIGFELLKVLLSGYIQGVAAKSVYGAFGVPVALLLWINFTTKILLFAASWTATPSKDAEPVEGEENAGDDGAGEKTAEKADENPGEKVAGKPGEKAGTETGEKAGDGAVVKGGSGGAEGRAAASDG